MIAKIKTRVDFGGIVNYANDQKNKKKCATLLAHEGVCAISNKLIADSFCLQASMRPKVKSPVKHVSLAFSSQDISRFPDNEEGDALMVEIAKKWMEQMGIRNTQYIIARHHDTKHPHCHLIFNRIDNEGNLISDSNERIRNAKVCRALTKEYGLYFAPKNSKARNKSRLRPHQLRKYNLRSSVLDARANSHSWNDFFSILKGLGIDMRFNHAENSDKIRGISFSQDEYSMAGSKLDRDLSFNSLCATLGNITAELIIQPHQAITPSGGGGANNEQGWRDDKNKDNERNEPFYKTSKRRRLMKEDVVAANLANLRQSINELKECIEKQNATVPKPEQSVKADFNEKAIYTGIAKSFCTCWNEALSVVKKHIWQQQPNTLPFSLWFPKLIDLFKQKSKLLEYLYRHVCDYNQNRMTIETNTRCILKRQDEILAKINELKSPVTVIPPNINGLFIYGYHIKLRYVMVFIVAIVTWAVVASASSMKYKEESFAYYSMYRAVKEQSGFILQRMEELTTKK